ncbi:MAG: hypothetical protein RIC12_01745 [Pirellulales bacterium]
MKKSHLIQLCSLAVTISVVSTNAVLGGMISGGEATLTITEGVANGISAFDAYFNDLASRAETLGDAAPGNEPFITPSAGVVEVVDPIRPGGEVPVPYPGTPGSSRSRQITTLDVDPNDVLGSWSVSNDAFAFVGNATLGEQIAFTSMQRYTGPFTGSLLYGDFGLRYTGSKLVLTSNIDFPNAAFADIGNPSISVVGNTLTITGDLLVGGGLNVLDPSAIPGTDFGDFSMTATIVPEPSSIILGSIAGLGLALFGLRHRLRSS